ncbi:MAG: hypothetical protein V4612_01320 [Pseudomonadota bacterium]
MRNSNTAVLSNSAMAAYKDQVSARKNAQENVARKPEDPQIGRKKTALTRVVSAFQTRDPNSDASAEEALLAAIKARKALDQVEAIKNERQAARDAIEENRAQIKNARKELGWWGRFKIALGFGSNEEKDFGREIDQCKKDIRNVGHAVNRDLNRITYNTMFGLKALRYGSLDTEAKYKANNAQERFKKLADGGIYDRLKGENLSEKSVAELQEKLKESRVKFFQKQYSDLKNAAENSYAKAEESLGKSLKTRRYLSDAKLSGGLDKSEGKSEETLKEIEARYKGERDEFFKAQREKRKDNKNLQALESMLSGLGLLEAVEQNFQNQKSSVQSAPIAQLQPQPQVPTQTQLQSQTQPQVPTQAQPQAPTQTQNTTQTQVKAQTQAATAQTQVLTPESNREQMRAARLGKLDPQFPKDQAPAPQAGNGDDQKRSDVDANIARRFETLRGEGAKKKEPQIKVEDLDQKLKQWKDAMQKFPLQEKRKIGTAVPDGKPQEEDKSKSAALEDEPLTPRGDGEVKTPSVRDIVSAIELGQKIEAKQPSASRKRVSFAQDVLDERKKVADPVVEAVDSVAEVSFTKRVDDRKEDAKSATHSH